MSALLPDALTALNACVGAASTCESDEVRLLYLARARGLLSVVETAVDSARGNIVAMESELARKAKVSQ